MKKLFAFLTVVVLTFCLAGCGAEIDVNIDDPEGLVSEVISAMPDSSEQTSSESEADAVSTPSDTLSEEESEPQSSTSSESKPASPSSTETSSVIKPSSTQSTPSETTVNEFFSSSNGFVTPNELSVRPRHVYWDGNVLVADCYIVNGFSRAVYNIEVTNITLGNADVQIASAAFGVCNGLVVQPNQSVVWTFKFGPDCIQSMGADITYLECSAATRFN